MAELDHLTYLRDDVDAFASTLDPSTLELAVPGCPGWDLRILAGHLGFVHRWSAAAVRSGVEPDLSTIEPPPSDAPALAEWVSAGGAALADELGRHQPDDPTWHLFSAAPLVVGVWIRRQTQETSVHRWDAQSAIGTPAPVAAELAADGVGEYFEVILPRKFARNGGSPPSRAEVLRVDATDTAGSWWVHTEGAGVVASDSSPGTSAAATVSGRAEDLLLAFYGRRDASTLVVEGDADLATEWLALGAN